MEKDCWYSWAKMLLVSPSCLPGPLRVHASTIVVIDKDLVSLQEELTVLIWKRDSDSVVAGRIE